MNKPAFKTFIIGLPRTGTTSVSVALLEQGLNVAHQAYTKRAFELADAVSDAPCFSDFRQLDELFDDARFVYLDRPLENWIPSMQMLLTKMKPHLQQKTGRFHPIMKRSFNHCFDVWQHENVTDDEHLSACYLTHQLAVFNYFEGRDDFLSIDVSDKGSLSKMLAFLDLAEGQSVTPEFPVLNVGKHVASWGEYKHPNKVNSNKAGIEQRKFFDYQL